MNLRAAVVGLIVLATIGFVVGTTIERNSEEAHADSPSAASSENSGESQGEAGESEEHRAAESGGESTSTESSGGEAAHGEFQPFGIDIEAVPFIVLGALGSLAIAAAVWIRPRSLPILGIAAVAMVLFAALDVREVFHQVDENRTALAVLAGVVAVLHLAAAAVIGLLARADAQPTGPAGTMPA
jgi:hypothetical protein